ncbi:MAG: phytanoyl-CoA dioxygenase family protein [Planctomycetes bacterium]|nr:phytanoyl-CoA dioxygenase family protein [Planctomycetota bacterium]
MVLSAAQIEFYRQSGYLVLEDILRHEEVEALKDRTHLAARGETAKGHSVTRQIEPALAGHPGMAAGEGYALRKMVRLAHADPIFRAHVERPVIVDCIVSLLESENIKLYQDQLFMKPPRIGSRQPYHQDQPLGFHIDPPHLIACWTALDDSTLENGCLRVLPGTHRSGVWPRERLQELEARARECPPPEEVPIPLRAGSCSFHHGHLLHCSEANRSDCRRWGYAVHYVPAEVRYTGPEPRPDFLLIRGQSKSGCI